MEIPLVNQEKSNHPRSEIDLDRTMDFSMSDKKPGLHGIRSFLLSDTNAINVTWHLLCLIVCANLLKFFAERLLLMLAPYPSSHRDILFMQC